MPRTKKTEQKNGEKLHLNVTARTIFGKKLKKLRKEGIVPANIYGPGFKSKSVSVNFKDFINTYKIAKETGVVYLKDGKEELPVLIKNVQKHPVNSSILHADFRKIDLTQKIQTEVPIKVVGQSEAVTQKGGVLLTLTESLLVEALPTDIPKEIVVDISTIKDIGREIKVADLKKSDKYEVKNPAVKVIVSVVEHKEESVTPETAPAEAPEVITAAPTEEGVATPTEEVGKPSTKTPEGKPAAKTPETKEAKPLSPQKSPQPSKAPEGKK